MNEIKVTFNFKTATLLLRNQVVICNNSKTNAANECFLS